MYVDVRGRMIMPGQPAQRSAQCQARSGGCHQGVVSDLLPTLC